MLVTLSPEEIKEMFDRIEERLVEIGLTVRDLCNKLGIQSQHWNNWKRRGIPPGRYSSIAKLLGCSVEWLTTGKDDREQDISSNGLRRLHSYAVGKIPVISMGTINLWLHNELQPSKFIHCPVEHSAQAYAVSVEGNQMVSPTPGQKSYPEGSILFVDPQQEVKSGKRVIAIMPGSTFEIFREYRQEGGINYLIPFNPQYKIIETPEDITFLGVVIAHVMPE